MIANDFLPGDAFSDCTAADRAEISDMLPRITLPAPVDGLACVSLDLTDAMDRIARRLGDGRIVLALATVARKTQRAAALAQGVHEFLTLGPLDPDQLSARLSFLAGCPALPADMSCDARRGLLKIGGAVHTLGEREVPLIQTLLARRGGFVTHGDLLETVWGSRDYDRQKLRVLVNRLRKRIEPEPGLPRYLLSEAAIGYRIGGPASERHI